MLKTVIIIILMVHELIRKVKNPWNNYSEGTATDYQSLNPLK